MEPLSPRASSTIESKAKPASHSPAAVAEASWPPAKVSSQSPSSIPAFRSPASGYRYPEAEFDEARCLPAKSSMLSMSESAGTTP